MRIISTFKDYYDYCIHLGVDPLCKYVRHTKDFPRKEIKKELGVIFDRLNPGYRLWFNYYQKIELQPKKARLDIKWIAFCGKLYIVGIGRVNRIRESIHYTVPLPKLMYDPEEIIDFIETHKLKSWTRLNLNILEKIQGSDLPLDMFIKTKSPIITEMYMEKEPISKNIIYAGDPNHVQLHAKLSDFKFMKIVPAEKAWQEISMFLMGTLRQGEKKPKPISDQLRAHNHGFNMASFRKDYHQSKPRKKWLKKKKKQ